MYTYLTAYDQNRHLASLSMRGAFDGQAAPARFPRRQTHPIRRIRHALAGLARHAVPQPVATVVPAV